MNDRRERRVHHISNDDAGLSGLLRQVHIYQALDAQLQQRLPEALKNHVHVACVRDQTLVLVAESAGWATRARLEADQWLHQLKPLWPKALTNCQVVVGPKPLA
jgi:hypothetical protein